MDQAANQPNIFPPVSSTQKSRRRHRINYWLLCVASNATLATIGAIPLAQAADIDVSTGTDLIQGLAAASTDPDPTTVYLHADVSITAPAVLTPAIAPESVTIDTTGGNILTLDGVGTVWDAGRYTTMVVEGSSDGGLTLSGGAKLTINDTASNTQPFGQLMQNSGVVTITGEGTNLQSSYFTVGRLGDSIVSISDGAHVVTTREAALGEGPGYTGATNVTVVVDGRGTTWTAGSFVAGGATDTVDLTFSGGAVVSATGTASIGRNGDTTLVVTGSDTKFTANVIHVGERSPWFAEPGLGDGTLTISDGGLVSAKSVVLGVTGNATPDPLISGSLIVDSDGVLETGELTPGLGKGTANFENGTLRATNNVASLIHGFEAGDFVLTNEGLYLDSNGLDVVAESAMSGDGALTKQGAGKLTVTGANIFSGDTTVAEGTLAAGATNTFSANSSHIVDAGTLLDLQGYDQTVLSLNNSGVVSLGGAPGTVLTESRDYIGSGGTILFNTALGDDASPTDLVKVDGDTSGTSFVKVVNVGGLGAQTHEGIKIVDVSGASNGQFALLGDYVIEGREAVVAGAYGYTLWQNGVVNPQDGDWYLRSQLREDDDTPLYQPGVPIYEVYPQVLLGLNSLPTLNQRVGNRYWNEPQVPTETVFCKDASQNYRCAVTSEQNQFYQDSQPGSRTDGSGLWALMEGTHAEFSADVTTSQANYDVNSWRLRAGIDGLIYDGAAGDFVAGINGHYGNASSDITSLFGNGSISTDAYGVGATATWYGNNGVYLDGQGQLTWFDSDLSSDVLGELVSNNRAFGYALSIEGGKRISVGEKWSLTPQAQLVYSSVNFDTFFDRSGAEVSTDRADSLAARLGLAIEHQNSWKNVEGKIERVSVHAIGNLRSELLDGTTVNVSATDFTSKNEAIWGELGLGGTYNWGSDKYSIYGDVGASTSLAAFGDSYSLNGRVGLWVQW